jgi:septal ring factor EnvC (AmiA/AmiB activator)
MYSIQKNNFITVIEALEKSVVELSHQEKEAATQTVLSVSQNILFLNDASKKLKLSAEEEQQKIADTVSEIIKSEASIRESYLSTQKSIENVNLSINTNSVKKTDLMNQIASLKKELADDQRLLQEHRRKLDELNDSSAWSIIRSILSIGLDRAIMGVQCLINNDAGRIQELNNQIQKFNEVLKNNSAEIEKADYLLTSLNESKRSYEVSLAQLKEKENILHENEQLSRNNLAFITNAALFYGKLSVMLNQIGHRIDDIVDIVSELNDKTPTIIDFDSSGTSLVSLREAMVKFDKVLETSGVA